ncbi:MAG: hypothetical protein QF707_01685 [Candidatus Poseidoniaceae archaeon]|nr:hypothetical protein [Candidatus Poseidoniaceae archaeon]MDP7202951.1 hypothetical protein [Candidatus Poseidoniaceae archaeon]
MSEGDSSPNEDSVDDGVDLRDKLQAMEKRLSKLREIRGQHNDKANRSADQRNAVQKQYKEQRKKLDLKLEEIKAIRAIVKQHKDRRNSIQSQMKELFGRQRSSRDNEKKGRSVGAEYNKLSAEVSGIEERLETSGTITLETEKKLVKMVKDMHKRLAELEPELKAQELIKVDLDDIEGTIARMKQEADDAHQLMLEKVSEADEASKGMDEMFSHRDFLKAEGDRFHDAFVADKEKANEIHEKALELMKQVTEVKGLMKAERKERRSWIDDHNASVVAEMQTGADSDEVADELVKSLLEDGNLSIGGTLDSDSKETVQRTKRKPKNKKKKITPWRKE